MPQPKTQLRKQPLRLGPQRSSEQLSQSRSSPAQFLKTEESQHKATVKPEISSATRTKEKQTKIYLKALKKKIEEKEKEKKKEKEKRKKKKRKKKRKKKKKEKKEEEINK